MLLLVVGGLPAFFVEAKFADQAFRLFRWRSPETREMMYLESVMAREDYTKEVKLFEPGPEAARSLQGGHFRQAVYRRTVR